MSNPVAKGPVPPSPLDIPTAAPAIPSTKRLNLCQQILVLFLYICMLCGLIFNVITLSSCNFFIFNQKPGNLQLTSVFPESAALISNTTGNETTMTRAAFGMLSWSPNLYGCVDYEDPSELGVAFRAGQVGGLLGTAFGITAVIIESAELTCCRFVCAKVLSCICLIVCLLGQGLTFVMFASDICLNPGNVVYACDMGGGCLTSIISFTFFLLSMILICPTPKPTPLCKIIADHCRHNRQKKRDNNDVVSDPCCYCFKFDKNKDNTQDKTASTTTAANPDNSNNVVVVADAEIGLNNRHQQGVGNNDDIDDEDSSVYDDTIAEEPTVPNEVVAYAPLPPTKSKANKAKTKTKRQNNHSSAAVVSPTRSYDNNSSSQIGASYYDNSGGERYNYPPHSDPVFASVASRPYYDCPAGSGPGPDQFYHPSSASSISAATSPPSYRYRPQPQQYPIQPQQYPIQPQQYRQPPQPYRNRPQPPPQSYPQPPQQYQQQRQQYHYFAPPVTPSPFTNAEVMDGDLFFDSKTVG